MKNPPDLNHDNVIIFDGICKLCNASVHFIIAKDHKNVFKFAHTQSETAKKIFATNNLSTEKIDTIILVKNGTLLTKSDALLNITKEFKNAWLYLMFLKIIPRPISNYCYTLIAHNRYKWFGKKDRCMIPTPQLSNKFLDWYCKSNDGPSPTNSALNKNSPTINKLNNIDRHSQLSAQAAP